MTAPAVARIECRGDFQVTKNDLIATPYCEEEQIAFVMRSYGSKVTGAQVHNDPLTKVHPCQTIGYDWRLKGFCAGYGPDSYAPLVNLIRHAKRWMDRAPRARSLHDDEQARAQGRTFWLRVRRKPR